MLCYGAFSCGRPRRPSHRMPCNGAGSHPARTRRGTAPSGFWTPPAPTTRTCRHWRTTVHGLSWSTCGTRRRPAPWPCNAGSTSRSRPLGPATSGRWRRRLAQYAWEIVEAEVVSIDSLTSQQRDVSRSIRTLRTSAHRDARPVAGRFPVVILHRGYGSSFTDPEVSAETGRALRRLRQSAARGNRYPRQVVARRDCHG